LQHGDKFLLVQIYDENLARFFRTKTSGAFSETLGHKKPFWFSAVYLLTASLPWCIFLPDVIKKNWSKIKSQNQTDPLTLFSIFWIVIFIFVITISSSKRSVYFLPALP